MQIIHDYEALHAIPELDRNLPKTVAYVKKQLEGLGCRVFSPIKGAVCAWFDFGKAKTVAFRADMDALPFPTGPYHACGHDGHTAILLELARRVRKQKQMPHNILLIFQPAEETDGGAEPLCRTGLLDQYRVGCIFGLHLWPGLEKGAICSRSGPLMSNSCGIQAVFTGKSRHIAQPGSGDALAGAVEFYRMAENIQAPQPFLLKFGLLQAGTAGNILCGKAVLAGSLRTFDLQLQHRLCDKLKLLARTISNKHRITAEIRFSQGYPAIHNDPVLYEKLIKIWPVQALENPVWTTDDFSAFQKRVPGVYALLGVGDTPPLHSPEFQFDKNVLLCGADYFSHISRTALIG